MRCPACNKENPPGAESCEFCRTPLFDAARRFQPTAPVSGATVLDTGYEPGSLIAGRYLIVRELGRGGMGVVYLVQDQQLRGKEMALKLISAELTADPQAKDRFIQEVLAAQEMTHRNVVRVYHLDDVDGQSFFTMEFIPGQSLREIVEDRKEKGRTFSVKECQTLLLPVLECLDHAHTLVPPVIHRDIKPENIIISDEISSPLVKVLDFGLAKMLSPSKMTSTALNMGTAYYMAPEQLMGARDIDQRADLFSVGVMLYEMLTGEIPTGRFDLPCEIDSTLPPAIDSIVDFSLRQIPAKRFASARMMLDALHAVGRQTGVQDSARAASSGQASVVGGAPLSDQRPTAKISGQPGTSSGLVNVDALVRTEPWKKVKPPTRKKTKEWRDPASGMEFVWVPPGCFQMGFDRGEPDAMPAHEVCVTGLWMGRYAVTQEEWQRIMKTNPSYFKGARNPVECVSWSDAQAFVRKLNGRNNGTFRLPTEAEWEFAARSGGRKEIFAGGDNPDSVAWYAVNSGDRTHAVGTMKANALGLFDMSGNVWEWCEDTYDAKAYAMHSKYDPFYNKGRGTERVMRGGAFGSGSGSVRTRVRSWGKADLGFKGLGFRVVRLEK